MLKTDYIDDIPETARRKYQMIDNGDNTVSFNDVTSYTQSGDPFGASDINATNEAVNENTSDIAEINVALEGKADKVERNKYTYSILNNLTSIQQIFDKIETERGIGNLYLIHRVGTRIRMKPRGTWTEGDATYSISLYDMECVYAAEVNVTMDGKDAILSTAVYRGALLGKSFELAYRYRSYTESGFPNPGTNFPNIVTYFKDYDGTDVSTSAKYLGDGCEFDVEPIKVS